MRFLPPQCLRLLSQRPHWGGKPVSVQIVWRAHFTECLTIHFLPAFLVDLENGHVKKQLSQEVGSFKASMSPVLFLGKSSHSLLLHLSCSHLLSPLKKPGSASYHDQFLLLLATSPKQPSITSGTALAILPLWFHLQGLHGHQKGLRTPVSPKPCSGAWLCSWSGSLMPMFVNRVEAIPELVMPCCIKQAGVVPVK